MADLLEPIRRQRQSVSRRATRSEAAALHVESGPTTNAHATASEGLKPAIDSVAPNTAVLHHLLGLYLPRVEETVPKGLVHRPHVRRSLRICLFEVVEVRSLLSIDDLDRPARRPGHGRLLAAAIRF